MCWTLRLNSLCSGSIPGRRGLVDTVIFEFEEIFFRNTLSLSSLQDIPLFLLKPKTHSRPQLFFLFSSTDIWWHIYQFLGNDCEISTYTRAVAKWRLCQKRPIPGTGLLEVTRALRPTLWRRNSVFCEFRAEILQTEQARGCTYS